MYLTEKILKIENNTIKEVEITLYSEVEIKKGDKYDHRMSRNTFEVSEVIDSKFPAKGDHKKDVFWYRILLAG